MTERIASVHIDATLDLITTAPLHVGTGRGQGGIQRAMLRDDRGLPFIPGSTLKGRARHAAWQICSWAGLDPEPDAVGDLLPRPIGDGRDLVQRIFGTASQRCALRFCDAYLIDPPDLGRRSERPYLRERACGLREVRPGAARARLLGTVSPGRLYSAEVATTGLPLRGQIHGYLPTGCDVDCEHSGEVIVLWLSLQLMLRQDLGGLKSTGCGAVQGTVRMLVDGASFTMSEEDLGAAVGLLRYAQGAKEVAP